MPLNSGFPLRSLQSLPSKISLGFAVLLLAGFGVAGAQIASRPVADRLVQPINENARVTLGGTVHPLANAKNDRGAAADGMRLNRLQIVLKRSDAQEAELKQLLSDMHTPGTENYHKWLTPDDFGKRFGPSDADVAKLTAWLQSHGFNVTKLNPGRQTLEFTGSAGQFRDTFKTQIHAYQVKGAAGMETHYANATDPQIPAALAPVLGGFASLNNFRLKSYSHRLGTASFNPKTHEAKPDWTVGNGTEFNLPLSPADFAVQYSIPSQAVAGTNDGTGQSIAVVNEANIDIALVNRFRTLFGLPANPPQVIIDGNDPGIDGINNADGENGATGEAYLDVEWAGAVAPGATVNLVIGADTELENGLAFGAERAVYSNISPVISLSFGNCEAALGAGNAFWQQLWEQAAAQGITVAVSTGDSGSAGCDGSGQAFAVYGQEVSGIASTPYNVAVGGTDFYYTNYAGGATALYTANSALNTEVSGYWNLTPSNSAPIVSLKKPVPEQPWNDSQYGKDIFSYYGDNGNTTIAGGGGGASNCAVGVQDSNGNYTSCTSGYAKPSWQSGTGVPADRVRDIPDLSLFASNGSNNTYFTTCSTDGDCEPVSSGDVQVTGEGGTSASTPSFAGVMALVNQKYGRQGQAGFVLYPLAAQYPAVFNDVQVGTNSVPCNLETVYDGSGNGYAPNDCITVSNELTGNDATYGTSTEGEIGLSSTAAYNAGTGYDLASGLGTLNVTNLLADWNKVTFKTTTVTLTPSVTTFTHGTSVMISGNVTGTGTPTGDVALVTDSTEPVQQGQTYFTLTNGAYSDSVSFLPGGTYNIWGTYGGDSANAASSSIANKVQVTVAPEASKTSLYLYSGYTSLGSIVSTPSSVPYGTQVLLSGQAGPSSGAAHDTTPTGSVVFKDSGTTIDTAVVNAEGDAEFYSNLAPGSHSITAAYSGDNSYNASTSTATALTVVKDTPTFNVVISNQNSNSGTTYGPQQTYLIISFENSNSSSQNALAPTGTVTVTGAPSGTLTGTLTPGVDPFTNATVGSVTLALPSGTTSGTLDLTFAYAGDSNYSATSAGPYAFAFASSGSGLTSSTAAVASPATAGPSAAVQVTTTVTGQAGKPVPTGTITLFGPNAEFGTFTLPTGSGDSTTLTLEVDSEGLLQGTNLLTVQYSGDANYLPSAGTVTVLNPLSDFQMVPLTTIISVPSTATATDTINLTSTNSFAGAVSFTCKGAGGVTCSLTPASATLTAGGQGSVTLTVNSSAVTAIGTYNVVVTGSDSTGNFVHTLGFQVVVPQVSGTTTPSYAETGTALGTVTVGNSATSTITTTPSGGFTGSVALSCAVTGPTGAVSLPTCTFSPSSVAITGTTAVTSTLTVATTSTTTTGTYSVVVTGTSGSTTESVTLPLVVNAATSETFALTGTALATVTVGNATTSTITTTPSGGFTGSVALSCAVTGPTGAVSLPTCSLAPASANVTSTAAVTSTLTVATTATTTVGSYSVVVTGVSGGTTESVTLTLPVAATPSFTLTGLAAEGVTAGAAPTSTLTVTPTNGFAGSVALTCAVTGPTGAADVPTCALVPATANISGTTAATSTLTVTTLAGTTAGDYTVTVTGTGTQTGQTVSAQQTESFVLTVTSATTTGSIAVSAPAITIASQGASGTSTVTVTPSGGFTGSVALACAVTASPTGAIDTPTCALTPASVSITGTAVGTTTLTVNTTAQTTAQLKMPGGMLFPVGSGVTLAALFFLGGPIGRRRKMTLKSVRTMRILSAAMLFALLAGGAIGCGSGSHSGGGGGTPTGGTTLGTYTVTLTATPATGTAVTTTVAVTVN